MQKHKIDDRVEYFSQQRLTTGMVIGIESYMDTWYRCQEDDGFVSLVNNPKAIAARVDWSKVSERISPDELRISSSQFDDK